MIRLSPLTQTALSLAVMAILVAGLLSCSSEAPSYQLSSKFPAVGAIYTYKMDSHQVARIYENDSLIREVDSKMEGDISYTAKDLLSDGAAVVREENRWSWDEPGDSGQIKRVTKEYAYEMTILPNGKVIDLKMIDKPSQSWEDYVKRYSDQGMPVFPDEKISTGYTWTQKTPVDLPSGDTTTASMTYKIKGTTQKMGYNCAIIEYNGTVVLPLFRDPQDTTAFEMVDWIEMSGILYYGIDIGTSVNSEERRRVRSERTFIKGGKQIARRAESESVMSYNLVSLEGR